MFGKVSNDATGKRSSDIPIQQATACSAPGRFRRLLEGSKMRNATKVFATIMIVALVTGLAAYAEKAAKRRVAA